MTGVTLPAGLPPRLAQAGRCLVMGVLNVTPDSFSDGGRWFGAGEAVTRGLELLAQGADLLDVGGESTRPGAGRVPVPEELRRVLPVVRELVASGAVVSIDTTRAEVADAALAAGACLVNDVSGGLADPHMGALVAEARVPFVAMHWRGPSDTMDSLAQYDDVVEDVIRELRQRVAALVDDGVDERQLVLDPGFGFAKNAEQNWSLLGRLGEFAALGRPLLVGTSRKRFLAQALTPALASAAGSTAQSPAAGSTAQPPAARDAATAATSTMAALAGAWCVRVHEVAASADAVRVVAAARASAGPAGSPRSAGSA